MKPIETTKQDQSGCDRTSAIRRDDACGKVSDPETAAPDRIEMPIY